MKDYFDKDIVEILTPEIFRKLTEEYPSVIANEYLLLEGLFRDQQVFAALYETKDIYEVVLKLNVIISLMYLRQNGDPERFDQYEKELLGKSVSLGDWESILGRIDRQRLLPEGGLKRSVKDLINLFRKQGVVGWRNRVLGHGALSPDMENYAEDTISRIKAITDYLLSHEELYRGIHRIMINESDEETCVVSVDGIRLDLSPYLTYREGTYFFDSYLSYKLQTSLLDYALGNKIRVVIDALNERYSKLFSNDYSNRFLLNGVLNAEASTLPGFVNAWLNELNRSEGFVEMPEWDAWLSERLSRYDRGVFLLRADRAMGKTAFVSHLDPLMDGEELLEDTAVARAYYCGRRKYRQKDDFLDQMNSGMFLKMNSGDQLEGKRFQIRLGDGKEGAAEQLTRYLEFYRDYYREYYQLEDEGSVLLIIDGIDEISFRQSMEDVGILDYIPAAEDLPEHVYILITSRIEEGPQETYASEFIRRYAFTDRIDFRRRDEAKQISAVHRGNLQRFIRERLNGEVTPADSDRILELSDGNYISLKMLIKMLHGMKAEERQEFLREGFQPEHHLEDYLQTIYRNGGVKYGALADRLLAVLASAMEPVSLHVLAFLMDFNSSVITCDILGALKDVDALVQMDRSAEGSVIRLSNLRYQDALQRRYMGQIREFTENAVSYISTVYETGRKLREERQRLRLLCDAEGDAADASLKAQAEEVRSVLLQLYQQKEIIYLHAYILNYLEILEGADAEGCRSLREQIYSPEFMKYLVDFEIHTDGKKNGSWGCEKDRLISSGIIRIGEALSFEEKEKEIRRLRNLVIAYNCRSYSLFDLGVIGEAVADLDRAIEYGLRAHELGCDETDFGLLYNNKAVFLRNQGKGFAEFGIWMRKSLEYKEQKARENFRDKVEIYLVSVSNYVSMLFEEQLYEEMDRYCSLVFREGGILDEIRQQFPQYPYMIDEDNTRYEFGYLYLVTYIREIQLQSLYDRKMMHIDQVIEECASCEAAYRSLIDRNRQVIEEGVLIQEPLIRGLYKCLYRKGRYLAAAKRRDEAVCCWQESAELIRELDRSTRLNSVNKGLKKILLFLMEEKPLEPELQEYIAEVYERLYGGQ